MIPLIFPKVPQSFVGILRVPQLPPPLGHPPPLEPYNETIMKPENDGFFGDRSGYFMSYLGDHPGTCK